MEALHEGVQANRLARFTPQPLIGCTPVSQSQGAYSQRRVKISTCLQRRSHHLGKMATCPSAVKYNCTGYNFICLDAFAYNYDIIHIPLSLVICICGVVANIVNVIVLSQPPMRSSTNLLLAALSFGEGMVMALYIFYVSAFRIDRRLERGMTQGYAYALFGNVYAQNLFHAFSSWMIVFLAAFRLAFMRAGVLASKTCSYTRARTVIIIDAILSLTLAAPFLFAHHVVKDAARKINGTQAFKLDFVPNPSLTTLLLVSTGVFIKGLPLILMTVFSAMLIRTLRISLKRHDRLQKNERSDVEDTLVSSHGNGRSMSISVRQRDHDSSSRNVRQTTNIMFALILLYIITYMPQVSQAFSFLMRLSKLSQLFLTTGLFFSSS